MDETIPTATMPTADERNALNEAVKQLPSLSALKTLRNKLLSTPTPVAIAPLTVEQRDAINEAICWANEDGLPGTADTLRSILSAAKPVSVDAEDQRN